LSHSSGERISEKGVAGIFKCRDCGKEMSAGELITTECEAIDRTSQDTALIDAIEQE